MSLGQSLQKYTYEYLLQQALNQVPDTVDKREGSIIFDALAPACYVLAEYFVEMHRLSQEVSIETASGEWLDNKVLEVGIARNQATPAVKKAVFTAIDVQGNQIPLNVPIGSRFATISDDQPLYYTVTDVYRDPETGVIEVGAYEATCQTTGTAGDHYIGPIVPLDFVRDLATATLGNTVTPGTDTETDDDLRQRYLDKVRYRAFGGNVAQYKELALSIEGVGGVQVYPTWNGGGTVKLCIVDGSHNAIRNTDGTVGDFVATVQNIIDPDTLGRTPGMGLGSAPIDHRVTVVTPELYVVDITADVYLSGKTIDQVKPEIEAAIEAYFAQLRADWDNGDDMNNYSCVIYQSQIIRAALSVPNGIADFSNVVLKRQGTSTAQTNITLTQNGTTQQLPILGTVTLNVKS